MRTSIRISTHQRTEMIDITRQVEQVVHSHGIQSGVCIVFVPHTTAGITIQENADPDVKRDMLMEINKMVPFEDGYRHAEGNSAAHIKTALFGSSESILIDQGDLLLGRWQGIYFCEFDGPRQRTVHIRLIKDKEGE